MYYCHHLQKDMNSNKLPEEASGHHATQGRREKTCLTEGRRHVLVVEVLSGKTVQIDTSTHRQTDEKRAWQTASTPLGQRGVN
jgi:hypothetical protein